MRKFLRILKGLAALASFITIIPTRVHDISLAAEYFYLIPIIGILEGLAASLPALIPGAPYLIAAIVAALSYLVTGLNHIDGLADFVDAVYSGKRGEEALKIMKDPRRGSAAVAATSIAVVLTYAAVVAIVSGLRSWLDVAASICIAHVLAAESMYALAATGREPPYSGLGSLFIRSSRPSWKAAVSVLMSLLIIALLVVFRTHLLVPAVAAAAAVAASLTIVRQVSLRILGFISGDVLGAVFEVSKTSSLLALALVVTSVATISCI